MQPIPHGADEELRQLAGGPDLQPRIQGPFEFDERGRVPCDQPAAPAPLVVYARLLSRWIDTDDEPVSILNESIRQRQRLGLLDSSIAPLAKRPQVVPILAVQRGMSPLLRQRMFSVRDHLASSGVAEAQLLEVHEVNLAGRMTRIDG